MLSFAIVRAVEIVGEAAANIGDETKEHLLGVPWTHIVGMRSRLVHAYFSIDAARVWDTLHDDLPPLIAELESAVTQAAG